MKRQLACNKRRGIRTHVFSSWEELPRFHHPYFVAAWLRIVLFGQVGFL